jgi:hypothetical protein
VNQNSKFETPDLGFTVTNTEAGEVRVDGKGSWLIFVPISLFGGFMIGGLIGGGNTLRLIISLLATAAILFGANRYKSKPFSFTVSDKGVKKDGNVYSRENIGEIFIENGHDKSGPLATGSGGLIVGGVGVGGITAAVTHASVVAGGSAFVGASVGAGAKVNFRVGFMYGTKKVYLARHLNAAKANSLFAFLTQES